MEQLPPKYPKTLAGVRGLGLMISMGWLPVFQSAHRRRPNPPR